MSTPSSKISGPSVQQQIAEEEMNYANALGKDAPFAVLKQIRNKIKSLKEKKLNKKTEQRDQKT